MSKKIKEKTVVDRLTDPNTGEIIQQAEHVEISHYDDGYKQQYVKMMQQMGSDLARLYDMSKAEHNLFVNLLTKVAYNNVVCFAGPMRQMMLQQLGISDKTLEKCITSFKNRGVILPMKDQNGKIVKGWYFLDPNIAQKGDVNAIKQLCLNITYELDGHRYVQIGFVDDEGKVAFTNVGEDSLKLTTNW